MLQLLLLHVPVTRHMRNDAAGFLAGIVSPRLVVIPFSSFV